MTVHEILQLLRIKEKESGYSLENALSLKRYREKSNLQILRPSEAFYLPAVNSKARIKWGRIFIQQIFEFFGITADEYGPDEPVFLITEADKSHLTTNKPQHINLSHIKRKLGGGLKGLSYIGMIEPGYYNVIYNELGAQQKDVVSWHGHYLVWGISKKHLEHHLARIRPRFTPIMPSLCAVHQKAIESSQFGYKLWYVLKSPCKEYSIGKRRKPDERTGLARFKQNSRQLRPGHRVALFDLMRDMYLDELSMAGGEGCELLRRIKYEALREYRNQNGRGDRRP
jgi:hypothetical protein